MNVDILKLEQELKKRLTFPYQWGVRQNDYYNGQTSFIYKTYFFDDLILKIDELFKNRPDYNQFKNYALNRWFNFWSAKGIESIFCSCEGVKPELDEKNRLADFEINGIKFDHKSSVYPKGYDIQFSEAKKNPGDLIEWLYENQSTQQRYHLKNRLFIILYDSKFNEHWKLKVELSQIKTEIINYVNNFNENNLLKFSFEADSITLSDIIWFNK